MQRIEQQGMEKEALAKNVLSWIICAKRPLTINELLHAVAVETSSTYFDEDNLSDIQYMISLCAGLVVVDEESGIVRLIHYTTQGYFERTWQTWFPKAHQNIAMVSLTYLSFDKFATGPCANWNEYRDRLKENPVYHYAARYWGYHAKQAYSEVKDHMNKIFQCDLTLASAAQVLCLEKGFGSCIDSAHKGVYGLHLAAWFGLDDKVKELLQEPRYHNLVDNKGQTVLHWAIRNSQTLTVELLIREGINVNVADKEGMTALHYAARQGNGQLIHLLVRNGAHLEIVDNNGWTPFLTAADCVKTASIAELLSYDTAINVVDTMNRNALHLVIIAAKDESAYLVNRLLSKGVCPISCDTENMTPLHYAVANGNPKIVESILEAGVDINYGIERKLWRKITKTRRSFYILDKLPEKTDARTRDAAGLTPLHFAACSGDWSMTAYLLKKGANPNARCSEGDTPLHIALRNGLVNEKYNDAWTDIEWKIESLKFTIDDLEDYAEVHRLIDEARLKVINMLLASTDIDVNIQNTQLDSPLHSMSIRTYSDTIVAELLQKGADPHKRNNKGQTALHLACKTDDLDAVNRLLNAGCSITTEDTEGLTALHYAVGANKYELAKLIFDRHPDAASKLCLAIGRPLLHHHLQSYICDLADLSDREHLMALLLDNGASVNSVDMNGDSPLSIYLRSFVVEDRTDICRFLLERDADPLWTNSRGQNLAHVAMHNWRAEVGVLEHLKMYGVDLSRKDRGAKSILHHGAIHGSISQELICVLQRYNIDGLDEKDMKDKSPLEYAEEAAKRKRDQDTFHPSGWRETWENLKQMKNHELMQCHSRDTTKDDRLE